MAQGLNRGQPGRRKNTRPLPSPSRSQCPCQFEWRWRTSRWRCEDEVEDSTTSRLHDHLVAMVVPYLVSFFEGVNRAVGFPTATTGRLDPITQEGLAGDEVVGLRHRGRPLRDSI